MMMKLALLTSVLVACGGSSPTPTGTACPDPDPNTLTYENFGKPFMERYCVMCHASMLTRSMRHGAPLYHDFDTLIGVLQTPDHIDQQAGFGPDAENTFMPPERCPSTPGGPLAIDCPQPTDEERRNLAQWIACEVDRPHTF